MKNYCGWCHQSDDALSLPGQLLPQNAPSPACPQCHRSITLVAIRKACELVGKSKRTIYQWIDKGLVSTVRSASGAPLICMSSLFAPADEKAHESSQKRHDQMKKTVRKGAI